MKGKGEIGNKIKKRWRCRKKRKENGIGKSPSGKKLKNLLRKVNDGKPATWKNF